eukprot:gene5758-226_t
MATGSNSDHESSESIRLPDTTSCSSSRAAASAASAAGAASAGSSGVHDGSILNQSLMPHHGHLHSSRIVSNNHDIVRHANSLLLKWSPDDLEALKEELKNDLKRFKDIRGKRTLSTESMANILHVYTKMKLDHMRELELEGSKNTKNYQLETARYLGYSASVVGKSFARWNEAKREHPGVCPTQVYAAGRRGNFSSKKTRVPIKPAIVKDVVRFIRQKRLKREKVSTKDVLDFLVNKKIIKLKQGKDKTKDHTAALLAVQRFLKKIGFNRRKRTLLGCTDRQIEMCNKYVKQVIENQYAHAQRLYSEVHIVEEYMEASDGSGVIFAFAISDQQIDSYSKKNEFVQHSDLMDRLGGFIEATFTYKYISNEQARNNLPPLPLKQENLNDKGISAIALPPASLIQPTQDSHGQPFQLQFPQTPAEALSSSSTSISPSINIQNEKARRRKKCEEISHSRKIFFEEWFKKKLLPILKHPSMIITSESYNYIAKPQFHIDPDTMSRGQIIAELKRQRIEFDGQEYCHALRTLLKKFLRKQYTTEIQKLTRGQGHKLLFAPSYFRETQPAMLIIDFLHSNIKPSERHTKEDLLNQIIQACNNLRSKTDPCLLDRIDEANRNVEQQYKLAFGKDIPASIPEKYSTASSEKPIKKKKPNVSSQKNIAHASPVPLVNNFSGIIHT